MEIKRQVFCRRDGFTSADYVELALNHRSEGTIEKCCENLVRAAGLGLGILVKSARNLIDEGTSSLLSSLAERDFKFVIFEAYPTLFCKTKLLESVKGANRIDFYLLVASTGSQVTNNIEKLKKITKNITVKILITPNNYRRLSSLIDFVVNQEISYVEPWHVYSIDLSFSKNQQDLFELDVASVMPFVKRILHKFKSPWEFWIEACHHVQSNLKSNFFEKNRETVLVRTIDIPRCLMGEYEIAMAENQSSVLYQNYRYEKDTQHFGMINSQFIKYEKCMICARNPICEGIQKEYLANNVRCDFRAFRPILSLETTENCMKLPFESDSSGIENLRNINADAICHYSGGIDSILAVQLYAEENTDKRIVLITYDNGFELKNGEVKRTTPKLLQNYPNIIGHYFIRIPLIMFEKYVCANLEKLRETLNFYPTCVLCKFIMYAYSIYLHRKYLKGIFIITGDRISRHNPDQTDVIKYSIEKLLRSYYLSSINPLWNFSDSQKYEVALLAEKKVRILPVQGYCLLTRLSQLDPSRDTLKKLAQYLDQEYVPQLAELIDFNINLPWT